MMDRKRSTGCWSLAKLNMLSEARMINKKRSTSFKWAKRDRRAIDENCEMRSTSNRRGLRNAIDENCETRSTKTAIDGLSETEIDELSGPNSTSETIKAIRSGIPAGQAAASTTHLDGFLCCGFKCAPQGPVIGSRMEARICSWSFAIGGGS